MTTFSRTKKKKQTKKRKEKNLPNLGEIKREKKRGRELI